MECPFCAIWGPPAYNMHRTGIASPLPPFQELVLTCYQGEDCIHQTGPGDVCIHCGLHWTGLDGN